MTAPKDTVTVVYDERVLAHQPDTNAAFPPSRMDKRIRQILSGLEVPWKYPEHPGRLTAIKTLLEQKPLPGLSLRNGRAATKDELNQVHTSHYLNEIFRLRGKNAWLDMDTTAVSPGSVEAAEVAAGCSIVAVDAVMNGDTESAFALVRPPGHHAEPVRARGFCLFNNIAVATTHAQAEYGCERVMIVDWDAHHGNGTQNIFWADPNVLFIDLHRAAPFYPGSGLLDEVGVGAGDGTTVNIPLPDGAGDLAYLKAFNEIIVPAADWFKPDLILVSAGFDAHRFDLALDVSYQGFGAMTGVLQQLARKHCDGHIAFVLEGGYNLESIANGVHAVLEVLTGSATPEPLVRGMAEVEAAVAFHLDAFLAP